MNTTLNEIRVKQAMGETMPAAVTLLNESEAYYTKIENNTRGESAPQITPGTWTEKELELDAVALAYIGDELVGCLRLVKWNTDCPVVGLNNLYVVPSARRKGVGSALVGFAISNARRMDRHLELGILAENALALKFWKNYRMKKVYSWYWMF